MTYQLRHTNSFFVIAWEIHNNWFKRGMNVSEAVYVAMDMSTIELRNKRQCRVLSLKCGTDDDKLTFLRCNGILYECCYIERNWIASTVINIFSIEYDLQTRCKLSIDIFCTWHPTLQYKSFTYLWHIRINILCLVRDYCERFMNMKNDSVCFNPFKIK